MPGFGALRQLLAQGAGHEDVPGVGHRLHNGDLQIAALGGHHGKGGVLPRRGAHQQAGQPRLKSGEPRVLRGDPQGKAHRQVAQSNGDSRPDPPKKLLALHSKTLFRKARLLQE